MSQFADYSRLLYEIVTTVMALMALWQWVRRKIAREDKLDRLLQQFLPNGGSSIVDRVAKLEQVNKDQVERLGRIENAVKALTRDNHPEE